MTASVTAAVWREWQHPRDWRGRFITKGVHVSLPGGMIGTVTEIKPGRLEGDPARITVKTRDGRTGNLPSDRITVAQPPRGTAFIGDGTLATVGDEVGHTDESGHDYIKSINENGSVTVGARGSDVNDREVDPSTLTRSEAMRVDAQPQLEEEADADTPTAPYRSAVQAERDRAARRRNDERQRAVGEEVPSETNDEIVRLARDLNSGARRIGSSREAQMLRGAIAAWTGAYGSRPLPAAVQRHAGRFDWREMMYNYRVGPRRYRTTMISPETVLLRTLDAAPANAPELYRGMWDMSDEQLAEMSTVGNVIEMRPSSFTTNRAEADGFSGSPDANNRVVLHLSPGARALSIEKFATSRYEIQKEWISEGSFRVDSVRQDENGVTHVNITQVPSDPGPKKPPIDVPAHEGDASVPDGVSQESTEQPAPEPPTAPEDPLAPEPSEQDVVRQMEREGRATREEGEAAPSVAVGDQITVGNRSGRVVSVRPTSGIVVYEDDESGRRRSARINRVQPYDPDTAPVPPPAPLIPPLTDDAPDSDTAVPEPEPELEPEPESTPETPAAVPNFVPDDALESIATQEERRTWREARRRQAAAEAAAERAAASNRGTSQSAAEARHRRRAADIQREADEIREMLDQRYREQATDGGVKPRLDWMLEQTRNAPRDQAIDRMTPAQREELLSELQPVLSRLSRSRRMGDVGIRTRAQRLDDALQRRIREDAAANAPSGPSEPVAPFTERNVLEQIGNENFGTGELARLFNVPQPQMLRVLRRLERDGYIARNSGNEAGDTVSGGRRSISDLGWESTAGRDGDHSEVVAQYDADHPDATNEPIPVQPERTMPPIPQRQRPAPEPAPEPAPAPEAPAPEAPAGDAPLAVGDRIQVGSRSGTITSIRPSGVVVYNDGERLRSTRLDRVQRADGASQPPAPSAAPTPTDAPTPDGPEIKNTTTWQRWGGRAEEIAAANGPDITNMRRLLRTSEGQAQVRAQLHRMYNGEDDAGMGSAGHRVRFSRVRESGSRISLEGTIRDRDGVRIGHIQRTFIFRGGEPFEIHNDYFSISPEHQGQGTATDLYRRQENWAIQQGFKKITIDANIDVGGYAWARKGYDFSNKEQGRRYVRNLLRRAEGIAAEGSGYSMSEREAMRQAAIQLRDWDVSDKTPTPYEISELGKPATPPIPGTPMHPGKSLMLGTNWQAVKMLRPPRSSRR